MRKTLISLSACVIVALPRIVEGQPLVRLTSPAGEAAVSVGMLAQPTVDWERTGAAGTTESAYVRRLRLIAAVNLTPRLSILADSDTPNLGKRVGGERLRTTYLQDLVVTYAFRDELKIDGGLLMVPLSFNNLQSAASLLALGYGPYSFVSSAPTTSKIGRDQGIQARGYLAGKHLEYRVGGFRGVREVNPDAPVRVAGRVVWYPFDAQTGFFYAGTSHGKKKLLGVGASIDTQDGYSAKALDLFYEVPLRHRDAVTLQGNVIRYDGGDTLAQIAPQNTFLLESGYLWGGWNAGVYGQASWQDVDRAADTGAWQAGAVWWLRGHRANLKVGGGRVLRGRLPARTQLVVQTQAFVF